MPTVPPSLSRRWPLLLAAVLLVAAVAQASAAPSPTPAPRAEAASRPDGFQRTCGSIAVRGRRLRVDVAEGDGALVTCAQARRVGLRFVRDGHARFRVAGHAWDCYKARADGVGWAYHCFRHAAGDRYVDVGIDRRW